MTEYDASADDLAFYRRITAQLPLTVRPSVYEQLNKWPLLFPYERKQLANFLHGVNAFTPMEFKSQIAPLCALEEKMGVASWHFSETSNTMENSGQLARSPYYRQWRQAIQELFTAVNTKVRQSSPAEGKHGRAIILVLPASLPVDEHTAFSYWHARGQRVGIEGDSRDFIQLLTNRWTECVNALSAAGTSDSSDAWMIDAEKSSEQAIRAGKLPATSYLSYVQLNSFRQQFLADMNTIPRDLRTASDTMTMLEKRDWAEWWPHELAGQERLKNFVVDIYLSGNGALVLSSAFAQWTASEILRRARPRFLVTRFGLRNKPKPFTSIAVFENQAKVSPIPDTPDPENSAADAAILAYYVELAAQRYEEYDQALRICVAEHLNAAWIIAPEDSPLATVHTSISPEQLQKAIVQTLRT
jgi:hypothetical protein